MGWSRVVVALANRTSAECEGPDADLARLRERNLIDPVSTLLTVRARPRALLKLIFCGTPPDALRSGRPRLSHTKTPPASRAVKTVVRRDAPPSTWIARMHSQARSSVVAVAFARNKHQPMSRSPAAKLPPRPWINEPAPSMAPPRNSKPPSTRANRARNKRPIPVAPSAASASHQSPPPSIGPVRAMEEISTAIAVITTPSRNVLRQSARRSFTPDQRETPAEHSPSREVLGDEHKIRANAHASRRNAVGV